MLSSFVQQEYYKNCQQSTHSLFPFSLYIIFFSLSSLPVSIIQDLRFESYPERGEGERGRGEIRMSLYVCLRVSWVLLWGPLCGFGVYGDASVRERGEKERN